jgi:hypothetical protein
MIARNWSASGVFAVFIARKMSPVEMAGIS